MELKLVARKASAKHTNSLNRTFYGIETTGLNLDNVARWCLNRTFYGIETVFICSDPAKFSGLNRTFYGIETKEELNGIQPRIGLNRTFYGIETGVHDDLDTAEPCVLIVPFMELKHIIAKEMGMAAVS